MASINRATEKSAKNRVEINMVTRVNNTFPVLIDILTGILWCTKAYITPVA